MNFIHRFSGHLKTVVKHRFWVFYFSCKAGIPLRGLAHDISKFHPIEFLEGVKYFQGNRSPIDACKEKNGVSMAWMHHKGRNPHHYEFWQDNFDRSGQALDIPYKYSIEMICDFLAAGKTYMKKNFTYEADYLWWKRRTENPIAMHPHTKRFVDEMLNTMKNEGNCDCLKRQRSYIIYENTR